MINVYRNLGYGVTFVGAWTRDAFILAAVLYVDNSDLFHMTQGTPTDDKFLALVQQATDDWAGLVHATGGSLKPQKCFWYMLGWLWKKGKARLKTLSELPQVPLSARWNEGANSAQESGLSGKKLGIYVNPHMRTTSLCVMGSPYAIFLAIPARLHTGIPICIRRSLYAKLRIWGYKT
jgi:hypothetical protein